MDEEETKNPSSKKMALSKNHDEWFTAIAEEVIIDSSVEDAEMYPEIKLESETSEDTNEQEYETVDCIVNCDNNEEYICEVDTSQYIPVYQRSRRGRGGSSTPQKSILLNETPDERAARLARMSAYATQRLANETPEQRAKRLKRMSEYASKRLKSETSEQRAKRLARMSAYAAKRLAAESPEQRQARLARMSAYAAKRQAGKKYVEKNSKNMCLSNQS